MDFHDYHGADPCAPGLRDRIFDQNSGGASGQLYLYLYFTAVFLGIGRCDYGILLPDGELEEEGAEAVCPDLMDFFMYSLYNANFKAEYLGKKKSSAKINNILIQYLEYYRKPATEALKASKRFEPTTHISKLAEYADPIVSCGNQTGEGWFLTGEMIELIQSGVPNIVCAQPFGCLPNHVVGKGVIKELRRQYADTNIVAVDYDPGASEVNQLNRIKLMLSTAAKNM